MMKLKKRSTEGFIVEECLFGVADYYGSGCSSGNRDQLAASPVVWILMCVELIDSFGDAPEAAKGDSFILPSKKVSSSIVESIKNKNKTIILQNYYFVLSFFGSFRASVTAAASAVRETIVSIETVAEYCSQTFRWSHLPDTHHTMFMWICETTEGFDTDCMIFPLLVHCSSESIIESEKRDDLLTEQRKKERLVFRKCDHRQSPRHMAFRRIQRTTDVLHQFLCVQARYDEAIGI
jgi:hypothetical protein